MRRRRFDGRRAGVLAGLAAVVLGMSALPAAAARPAGAGAVPLSCTLSGPSQPPPAGQPVQLGFDLRNGGAQPVALLVWGTPFEPAWFAPYVTVHRGDTELRYGGASMKRGDPTADQYLRIAPGETRRATIDLSPVFDLRLPGHYRVEPRIVLHDLVVGNETTVPRPRERHVGVALDCNAVAFEIGGR